MSDIEAGEKVVLKSGGVTMTVAWVEDGNALCVWQDRANHKEQVYPVVVLMKYEPPTMSFETI